MVLVNVGDVLEKRIENGKKIEIEKEKEQKQKQQLTWYAHLRAPLPAKVPVPAAPLDRSNPCNSEVCRHAKQILVVPSRRPFRRGRVGAVEDHR